jgi:hypothetical protein
MKQIPTNGIHNKEIIQSSDLHNWPIKSNVTSNYTISELYLLREVLQ